MKLHFKICLYFYENGAWGSHCLQKKFLLRFPRIYISLFHSESLYSQFVYNFKYSLFHNFPYSILFYYYLYLSKQIDFQRKSTKKKFCVKKWSLAVPLVHVRYCLSFKGKYIIGSYLMWQMRAPREKNRMYDFFFEA